jgi:cyclopropane-fatty-acyl-phospholipid synthase
MHWAFFETFIESGTLAVIAPNGELRDFGKGNPNAAIEFSDPGCLAEILRNPEMNLGKTYVEGRWKPTAGSDLHSVLHVLRVNFEKTLTQTRWSALSQSVIAFLRSWNSLIASRRNVAHHYDLDETLFRTCLDHNMHYSCAYYRRADESLEQAQQAKCQHIARKLCLRPGQRLLGIGCGWGSLAVYLAEHHEVFVTGLTLSVEQLKVAEQRAMDTGLSHLVNFQLQDYRQHEKQYDRVVSVGMFEHVGKAAYRKFFACVERALATEGIALIHTIADQQRAGAVNPWIRQHIFPGGHIPSAGQVVPAIEQSRLAIADLECWRGHYALTLAEWNRRFQDDRAQFARTRGEAFCRMWEFYLVLCQTAFEVGHLAVHHWQLFKGDQTEIPVTRDYLHADGGKS